MSVYKLRGIDYQRFKFEFSARQVTNAKLWQLEPSGLATSPLQAEASAVPQDGFKRVFATREK